MNRIISSVCLTVFALGWTLTLTAAEKPKGYEAWKHAGSLWIDTTPTGADLPTDAVLEDFPLLVRFNDDRWFNFETKPDGTDVRFFTKDGEAPLPIAVDYWDQERKYGAVWVRVPEIRGNARQELRVVWGNTAAARIDPNLKLPVFSSANGYKSVWHFEGPKSGVGGTVDDAVGTLTMKDVDTTLTPGIVGSARHFGGKQGAFGGDKIPNYPTGANEHTTEAWFRAEKPNVTLLAWGNEEGGRGSKVRMMLRSPPHIRIDSNFSDVWTTDRLPLKEWIHVAHTYSKDDGRLYINGRLAGEAKPTLNFKSPAKLWLGGWYHNYDFVGDLDEVRISEVARSAAWIRLEYENQKPLQTAVGHLVQPGDELALSETTAEIEEGSHRTFQARAGGARKLYWLERRGDEETVIAVDRLSASFHAGRVTSDTDAALLLRAVYPDGVRTKQVAIKIKEKIPDPEFTLAAPERWDGVTPLVIEPKIENRAALGASSQRPLVFRYAFEGPAVVRDLDGAELTLRCALGSGPLSVKLAIDNGGTVVERKATIFIPKSADEPYVEREPADEELPADGQFYARDSRGHGRLMCRGKLAVPAAMVELRLYAGDKRVDTLSQKVVDSQFRITARIKSGLIKYRCELVAIDVAGKETKVHEARDLVCGDVFLIIGQSNAVATDFGKDAAPPPINEWVRTFGATAGDPKGTQSELWAPAQARNRGGVSEIGYWGMELGRRLVESQRIPICFINGAVGGTRIDQHQRSEGLDSIYGRLLWRVRAAKLTHGVRGIIWHQGENDQGADGPTGGFGWETYRDYFHNLAASWRQDYPNARHLYMFQIWPKSCAMGVRESDDVLREVQRKLPRDFTHLGIMSTLGINPPGGCHFPAAGYAEFARMIAPLIERDLYGRKFAESITPPNLLRAKYASTARDAIVLEFDQPVVWHDKLASEFLVDREKGRVVSGAVEGNRLTLRLAPAKPSAAKPAAPQPGSLKSAATNAPSRIAYLDSKQWSQERLLIGANGIAALTFYDVMIED